MLALPPPEQRTTLEAWLPLLAASSLLVGAVATLVLTLYHILRDFRRQPCLGLAAALVATIGVVLIGLRPPLHWGGLHAAALAVLCLSLSLLGGAWVQRGGAISVLFGSLQAAAPLVFSLLYVEFQRAQNVRLAQAFAALPEQNRLFLLLLATAGVLMVCMALLARLLLREQKAEWPGFEPEWPSSRAQRPTRSRWSGQPGDSWIGAATMHASRSFTGAQARFGSARESAGRKLKTLWNTKAGEAPPEGFSVWRYHDADATEDAELALSLRRSSSLAWPSLAVLLLALAAVGVALWAAYG
jgi:hypothetical protein